MNNLPYFFSFKKNNFVLFYLGVGHSWDPTNKQFNLIKGKFTNFLKIAKHPLVVVESQVRKNYDTETEAIIKGGEIGFMDFLCHTNNIPIICFEPNRSEEMTFLSTLFPKEKIAYYYFARVIAQWHRLSEKPEINSYISQFLQRDQKVSGWNNFEFSIEHLEEIHKQLFGSELNFGDINFFKKIENPMRDDNPFIEIVQSLRKYRNSFVIKKIKQIWNENDLFIVYGSGHALEHINEIKKGGI